MQNWIFNLCNTISGSYAITAGRALDTIAGAKEAMLKAENTVARALNTIAGAKEAMANAQDTVAGALHTIAGAKETMYSTIN